MLGTALLGAARRLSRHPPRLSTAARSVHMSAASSDAPAADVAPSEVPRKAGVTEGAWDKIDVQAVQEAEVDANRAGVVSTRLVGMSVKELEEMAESTGEKKYRGGCPLPSSCPPSPLHLSSLLTPAPPCSAC